MTYLYPDSAAHEHGGTGWDDLRVAANSIRPGVNTPNWGARGAAPFNGNLNLWWFDDIAVGANEHEVEFSAQIPHSYKEGTNIKPHVHWVPEGNAGAANQCVKWGLEYTWANAGVTFPATTTIYTDATDDSTQTVQGEQLVASRHYISAFAAITGTGKTVSSMLVCRLFRNSSHVDDDYLQEAGLLEFDFHFEVESIGSSGEYGK